MTIDDEEDEEGRRHGVPPAQHARGGDAPGDSHPRCAREKRQPGDAQALVRRRHVPAPPGEQGNQDDRNNDEGENRWINGGYDGTRGL